MRMANLIISASVFISVLGGASILLLWLFHPGWWQNRVIRLAALLLPAAAIISIISWAVGHNYSYPAFTDLGSRLAPLFLVMQISLLLSLPISGIFYSTGRILEKFGADKTGFSPKRRRLFKTLAAAFPATIMPSSMAGVAASYDGIRIPVRSIPVAGLPPALEGLKIAHISDIHLGIYVQLDDLRKAVEGLKEHQPDLVLVTGDIADDLRILPDALSIIDDLHPRYGTFASVGNHEYYRGISRVLAIFEAGPFPILINRYTTIGVGDAVISLGGADDPRTLRRDNTGFLAATVEKTLGNAPSDSFRLLMSHRPEGFNHASEAGIDLVLSGHTHGAQLGFAGRSLLEPIFPEKYLWGVYRRGNTTLFTSGGMGHWLPFRLGVPAEAPILVLKKG